MFDKLLTVCARSGDHDLAVKLIEQMERSGGMLCELDVVDWRW